MPHSQKHTQALAADRMLRLSGGHAILSVLQQGSEHIILYADATKIMNISQTSDYTPCCDHVKSEFEVCTIPFYIEVPDTFNIVPKCFV